MSNIVRVKYGGFEGISDAESADATFLGEYGDNTTSLAGKDINNDLTNELIVGAHGAGEGSPGAVFVLFGPISGVNDSSMAFTLVGEGGMTGISISNGDYDSDGQVDLLIGAPYENSIADAAGVVYLVFGFSVLISRADNNDDLLIEGGYLVCFYEIRVIRIPRYKIRLY